MPRRKKSKWSSFLRPSRKAILIGCLVFGLIVFSGFAYTQLRDDHQVSNQPSQDNSSGSNDDINLEPPTEQEKQEAQTHKQSLTENQTNPTSQPESGEKKVTPIITYADRYTVRAYVPGVFEDGGKCTATATNGSQTKTASSAAFANVSYTNCKPISWSLPSGSWSVVVSYSSDSAHGKSSTYEVH